MLASGRANVVKADGYPVSGGVAGRRSWRGLGTSGCLSILQASLVFAVVYFAYLMLKFGVSSMSNESMFVGESLTDPRQFVDRFLIPVALAQAIAMPIVLRPILVQDICSRLTNIGHTDDAKPRLFSLSGGWYAMRVPAVIARLPCLRSTPRRWSMPG